MGKIQTSRKHWFIRGMAGGFMVQAALNALSWFFRSSGWSDLCGATLNADSEALGFPFEIWREGHFYNGGWMINFPMLGLNVLAAAAFAVLGGAIAVALAPQFIRLIQEIEARAGSKQERKTKLTFSVRGMFFVITITAVMLAAVQTLGATPWLLGAIYIVGPLILILIAMAPVGLSWEQRVVVLLVFAILMLAGSIMVGTRMGMEFDRVLFGVFICWVPQSVFAAAMILAWSAMQGRLQSPS